LPVISSITATPSTSTTTVAFSWSGTQATNGTIAYGSTNVTDFTMTSSHSTSISGLGCGTTLNYNLTSCNAAGSCVVNTSLSVHILACTTSGGSGSSGSSPSASLTYTNSNGTNTTISNVSVIQKKVLIRLEEGNGTVKEILHYQFQLPKLTPYPASKGKTVFYLTVTFPALTCASYLNGSIILNAKPTSMTCTGGLTLKYQLTQKSGKFNLNLNLKWRPSPEATKKLYASTTMVSTALIKPITAHILSIKVPASKGKTVPKKK